MFGLLNSVPIFKGIDEVHLKVLEPCFDIITYDPGQVIFNQGDPAVYLYIILHGMMVIRYKPYDGPEMTLAQLREGSACGWSAVIGNPSYTTSVISKGNLQAIRIKGQELRKICEKYPETGVVVLDRLAHSVSKRWKDANLQIRQILNHNHISNAETESRVKI